MGPPPEFPMLRAAFWLLALVIITESVLTAVAGIGCFWMILEGRLPIGSCAGVSQQVREVWAEMLAAILALLLASRNPPPDP
jgi:hypothetical protein